MSSDHRQDPGLRDTLCAAADTMGLELCADRQAQLLDYLALLTKWNAVYNLTAVRSPADMIYHLLLDSLTVAPFVQGHRVADIGSGAGLPGIPLAIVAPHRDYLLIDSNGKKTRFLTQVKIELGLENVTIYHGRVEHYPATPGFDTVVCRALASLPNLIAIGGHLLAEDGIIVAHKGVYPETELAQIPATWCATVSRVVVPSLEDRERHIVVMRGAPPSEL
ncbi:MAG: 16S rRNA (guanine(527)-N(7))-methyltransferase RsmG [Gammaproteobacteria bacterium]|nr:16S rRNA (guanine(527)-N(7))-methyltransferase RsmG [Gammaproteobacteria bacterium]